MTPADLKEARRKLGLSQSELGDRLVSPRRADSLGKGNRPLTNRARCPIYRVSQTGQRPTATRENAMQLENRMCDTAREQTEIAASMAWGATKAWAQAHGHTLPFGAEDLLVTAEDIYYANFDRTVDGDVCDWLAAEILSDRGCASAIPRLFDTL